MRSISVSEFKTNPMAFVDEVTRTKEPIAILRNRIPVAQLLPLPELGKDEAQQDASVVPP